MLFLPVTATLWQGLPKILVGKLNAEETAASWAESISKLESKSVRGTPAEDSNKMALASGIARCNFSMRLSSISKVLTIALTLATASLERFIQSSIGGRGSKEVFGKEIVNIKPEFEDIKKISEDLGITIKKIEFIAQAHLEQLYHKYNQTEE